MFKYRQISILGVVCLVGLRLSVGWHFFNEGQSKVQGGGFSSYGFLASAKGPLADNFQELIPDYNGLVRLDQERMTRSLRDFTDGAAEHFKFSEQQQEKAEQACTASINELNGIFNKWNVEIYEYRRGYDRIREMQRDPTRQIDSLAQQRVTVESDWRKKIAPILPTIDQLTKRLEEKLNSPARGASSEQFAASGYYSYSLPDTPAISISMVDKIIPIFDMVVGILLLIGLLTPVASLAAAIFLFSVILTQFPGSYGAQPTYYQAIEMLACLVLAACDAGRYAGLDFLGWTWWKKRYETKLAKQY